MQTQQQQVIDAAMPLQVTLQAQEWNAILATLNDAPYRLAAPLIQSIGRQLQEQTGAVLGAAENGIDPQPMTPMQ